MPIYSRAVFKEQFPDEERQTKWKGWSYVRKGVYWCNRAYDMGARGGKVFKVDIDEWKGRGRAEGVWDVALAEVAEKAESSDSSSDEEGSMASAGEESGDDEDEAMEVDEEDDEEKPKRKRRTKATPAKKAVPQKRKRKAPEELKEPTRRRRAPHAKASASHLPPTVEIDTLPTDPYERALRLLHVGATPESLPCREEEFVDVLSRVEEGIEGGGEGCLCELT